MTNLTKNQESFIELMKKSDEHAFRGFDLLAKREDADKFFDAVRAAGLFEPDQNPAPVPVEPAGSVRIPFWAALGYLVACATIADKRNDSALAEKVMEVVRAATTFREPGDVIRDNYHTFRVFAEIIGIVPSSVVSDQDVNLVPTWLSSRFDSDTVARALDKGPVRRFLASDDTKNWKKATEIVRHCLAFRWEEKKTGVRNQEEPVTVVDGYWLKDLINHHASDLGRKVGKESATVFRDAVGQLFGKGGRASWSYLYRPAVEDHGQNRSWKNAENAFVEGLRDVLLSWTETDPAQASPFVKEMLSHDVEMIRRVGIFLVNERWGELRHLYSEMLSPALFQSGHIHELYNLLGRRFEALSTAEKDATLDAIRRIPESEGEDSKNRLKRTQRRWLESISSTTFGAATKWLKELSGDPNIGVPEHPDFNSYVGTGWGPGRSPYELQELVALAEQGTLADSLKAFVPTASWKAPTSEALVQTLQRAVMAAPESFVAVLPSLVDVGVEYQTAVVTGFRRLWEADKDKTPGDTRANWAEIWPGLFGFFEALFKNPDAGMKSRPQSWLLSEVADVLHGGTRSDEHAYPAELLPRGWELTKTFVARAEATQGPGEDDPMTAAINSPRGHAIEAAVSHALRACRLADEADGSHAAAWGQMRELFDAELQKTVQDSYEFSTLLGAYLANFDYLDTAWVSNNLHLIFPVGRPQFLSAVAGLAYAPATDRIYGMLKDAGVIDAALSETKDPDTRQKLFERVAIAYLRGEDSLARFSFDHARAEDLQHAAWFMGSLGGEKLEAGQKIRILEFFDRCVTWAKAQAAPPGDLLSSLSGLAWVLDDADGGRRELLLAVAPYVERHHRLYDFLLELSRLLEVSREGVADVLDKIIETHPELFYDYEGRLKSIIERLFDLGDRARALAFCDRLRNVKGIPDLFAKLRAQG